MRTKVDHRRRRHHRVRKKLLGTADRPRLAVFRSNRHVYAQLIDDLAGATLVAASTLDAGLRSEVAGVTKDSAARVGRLIAERARQKGVSKVVFDRGGFLFHGRIKALADAAREQGLEF